MKLLFQVLILVLHLIFLVSGKADITAGLSFDCARNGSMLIFGVEAASYGSIYATGMNQTNDTECSCTRNVCGQNVTFEIRNCDINLPVKVILMHEKQTDTDRTNVVGGMNVSFYQLHCNNIPIGGSFFEKKFNLSDGETVTYKPYTEPSFSLDMEVQDGQRKKINQPVSIGTELHLVIFGTVGFDFYLETCLATDENHEHNKSLVRDGSSLDKNLLLNFVDTSNKTVSNNGTTTTPNSHILDATLYAFHFVGSHVVEIVCNITVCQSDDTSCYRSSTTGSIPSTTATTKSSASNGRRRKRDVARAGPRTQTLRTDITVIDKFPEYGNDVKTSVASKGPAVWLSQTLLLGGIVLTQMWSLDLV